MVDGYGYQYRTGDLATNASSFAGLWNKTTSAPAAARTSRVAAVRPADFNIKPGHGFCCIRIRSRLDDRTMQRHPSDGESGMADIVSMDAGRPTTETVAAVLLRAAGALAPVVHCHR